MKNETVKHETNYPPSASAGGDNAYYLRGCDTVQRSPSYASCLFKISEVEAGRDSEYVRECAGPIKSGQCQAKGMREQEQLQGAALYYFPRNPPQALLLPVAVAGEFGVRITNLTDPALIPKDPSGKQPSRFGSDAGQRKPAPVAKPKSMLDTIDTGSYADAINVPARAPAAKKPITKDDLAKLAMPGESLIETAKRLLNQTKETHAI